MRGIGLKAMNRTELKAILEAEGFPVQAYSLDGGLPDEAYCIGLDGDGWVYYYSERGGRSGLLSFPDEASACTYLLERLRHDIGGRPRPQ
ncbi:MULTISPECIES: hypothetical protein [Streptacidiphilus]|uniref:Immunity protein 35 domain-containing protein n=1 Tax=Streptacidiphilus cavernicola TaxID=3342716 RepID=A0ABV6UTQ2_9ACTN|nr:hypothetical protein [Streptacidiphilus jeojiense]